MARGSGTPSRIVGILGGMGPAATADFYQKLVINTPADRDQDHLRVVIWSDPSVPDRQAAILGNGTDPTPWLEEGLERLARIGADLIVMPCNTAHAFLPRSMPRRLEFINMIEATIVAVRRLAPTGRVGLLATDGALACDLFQSSLEAGGYVTLVPGQKEQRTLMSIVEGVKARGANPADAARLESLLLALLAMGAEMVIVGCTELSALLPDISVPETLHIVDPALELALVTIERATSPGPRSSLPVDSR